MPFAEQPATGLLGLLGRWLLPEYRAISPGLPAQGVETFTVPTTTGTSTIVLVPRICLEFFLQDAPTYASYKKNSTQHATASYTRYKNSTTQDSVHDSSNRYHEVPTVHNTWVLALVNDSWFAPQLRTILQLVARKKSHEIGLRVVYIGHTGCYTMTP